MKKKLRLALIVIASVALLVMVLFFAIFMIMGKKINDNIDKQVNAEINMEQVADGIYTGSSDTGIVKVEVEVEVKNHEIVNINLLKHQCGKGKPAESMIEEMVKKNTDDVDCVSGATVSSKTIRNAVNSALQNGMEGK